MGMLLHQRLAGVLPTVVGLKDRVLGRLRSPLTDRSPRGISLANAISRFSPTAGRRRASRAGRSALGFQPPPRSPRSIATRRRCSRSIAIATASRSAPASARSRRSRAASPSRSSITRLRPSCARSIALRALTSRTSRRSTTSGAASRSTSFLASAATTGSSRRTSSSTSPISSRSSAECAPAQAGRSPVARRPRQALLLRLLPLAEHHRRRAAGVAEERRRHPAGVVFDHVAQIVARRRGDVDAQTGRGDFRLTTSSTTPSRRSSARARAAPTSMCTAGASRRRASP